MATVTFDQAIRVFRDGDRPAIDRLDLEIHDGEFLVLVGREGGLDATVDVVEELGSESYLYCTAQGMDHQEPVVRTEGLSSSQRGDQVSLVPKPEAEHLFDTATGLRLADA